MLQLSVQVENHTNICKIKCSSKNKKYNWSHLYYSVYDSYAMLLESHFFDLPGKRFLVHQANEHSKGGHCEFETQLMDLEGNVLSKFSGKYRSKYLLKDKYLWFLHSENNSLSLICDKGLFLIKLNHITGEIKQKTELNYSELLGDVGTMVLSVNFIEKRDHYFLHISYIDASKNKNQKKIPLLTL
jgi:hypothetical protein